MKRKSRKQRGGFLLGLGLLSNLLKGGGVVKKKGRKRKNAKNNCRCKKVFIE